MSHFRYIEEWGKGIYVQFSKRVIRAAILGSTVAVATVSAYAEGHSDNSFLNRLTVGGYGEAVYSYNFFSDDYKRYSSPEKYRDASHGRFDLPHVVIYLGYNFGKGWSMTSEIEFEHGGVEAAVEIEPEESGEYEKEIERGGEVALEQFYIQKEFFPQLKVRAGMQVVPVGATNARHEPLNFFGVYRPEGENTIMPCTWHEVALSVVGTAGPWSYTAMLMPGLDSERFGNQGWIHDGSASPFEFKIANNLAGAARVDYRIPRAGLRLSVSGYAGRSFRNTLYPIDNSKNSGITGTVAIGSFDFDWNPRNAKVRGYFDYGHLSDSHHISDFNIHMSKNTTSKRQEIASDAIAAGVEAGYDIFSFIPRMSAENQRFYIFGRYDYYDSMYRMEHGTPLGWCGRQRIAAGVNWYPLPQIVVKGEYSIGLLEKRYNNEPAISIGVAYAGFFL
ncbi:MAG: hypothetical protein HDS68_01765 [Bacteroidales bacterium]|nr:hypothetical protein [Bacteroidales bacterium]